MARRSLNYKMFNSEDISSTVTSSKSSVDGIDQASVIIDWTGTSPVGVITFEGSNSLEKVHKSGTPVWEELDFGLAVISIIGNSGSHQVVFNALPFQFIRVKYTSTSGVGNITVHLNANSTGN